MARCGPVLHFTSILAYCWLGITENQISCLGSQNSYQYLWDQNVLPLPTLLLPGTFQGLWQDSGNRSRSYNEEISNYLGSRVYVYAQRRFPQSQQCGSQNMQRKLEWRQGLNQMASILVPQIYGKNACEWIIKKPLP